MKTRNAWRGAVCAALAALVSLALPLHAAARMDAATGVVGMAEPSQGRPPEEPPEGEPLGFAATGIDPDGRTAAASEPPAAEAPAAETQPVERSGALIGHSAAEDWPEEPTPAATGVGR
jgi:hypothetical protein